MPDWIRKMLVDSSGSRKPLARPNATTLRFQNLRRRPGVKRNRRGSPSGAPSRLPRSLAVASSSLVWALE